MDKPKAVVIPKKLEYPIEQLWERDLSEGVKNKLERIEEDEKIRSSNTV